MSRKLKTINNINQVLIISHYIHKALDKGSGAPHNIRNYFLKHNKGVTYIEHPFPKSNYPKSQMVYYNNGKKTKTINTFAYNFPQILMYLFQIIINWVFFIIQPKSYQICFALDNLSVISMIPFRKIGLIKKLVYYSVDYTPQRFSNQLLNKIFHYFDRIVSKYADVNWVAVEEIIDAKSKNGLNIKQTAPFIVVPIGFDKSHIKQNTKYLSNYHNLIFVGTLMEKQGLQLVIQAFPKLIKIWKDIKLSIIGTGDYENQLRTKVKNMKLTQNIKFLGFIDDYEKIMLLLSKASIGIATYDPLLANFSYYADPSKIKQYLICGLPVITTNVAPIAKEIAKYNLGRVIKYNQNSFVKALIEISENATIYNKYKNNALKYSNRFEINNILETALKNTYDSN